MTGFTANGEGGITQGAKENIFSVSNATTKVMGQHNLRFGVQAQLRNFDHLTEVPPRGGFTFNGQFTGNPVADFLLGYCSTCTGAFGSSRSTYNSLDRRAVHRRRVERFTKMSCSSDCGGNTSRRGTSRMASKACSIRCSGKIAYHQVPANLPPQLVPLIINQDGFYRSGHHRTRT